MKNVKNVIGGTWSSCFSTFVQSVGKSLMVGSSDGRDERRRLLILLTTHSIYNSSHIVLARKH